MLGRFLEISIPTPDILASIAFYETLGFVQVPTNEIWTHRYAVLTDGRAYLGLHQQQGADALNSVTLTFVQAELQRHYQQLLAQGHEFELVRLGDDCFNELRWRDPAGQALRLIEARTFSPPPIELTIAASHQSLCGYFVEYGIPVRSFEHSPQFWENLGFIAMAEDTRPFSRVPLISDHLSLGLHRSRALRQPHLVFDDPQMATRLQQLSERGHQLRDDMPDTLDEHSNAVLVAPEGTCLLLLQSETDQ